MHHTAHQQLSIFENKANIQTYTFQHAVKYHEARDWIHLQYQSAVTYDKLLSHCRTLETQCEQFQKAKEKGNANLTTITKLLPLHQFTKMPSTPSWNVENEATAPNVGRTIATARKVISVACAENQEGSPPRKNRTLNVIENCQGWDHKAETDSTTIGEQAKQQKKQPER